MQDCNTSPDEKPVFVYALVDPRDSAIRYVGQSQDPQMRLSSHVKNAHRGDNSHRSRWIRKLLEVSLEPTLHILQACSSREQASNSERFWISYGYAVGWQLTNMTAGGDGLFNPSDETRAKMSVNNASRRPEVREKIRESVRATMTPERRQRFSEHNPMKKPEVAKKIAAGLRGRFVSTETRAKIGANSGMKRPEVAERVAAFNRGKPLSDEHKAKLSVAGKGKKRSAETRARMSEAAKLREQKHREKRKEREQYYQLPLL